MPAPTADLPQNRIQRKSQGAARLSKCRIDSIERSTNEDHRKNGRKSGQINERREVVAHLKLRSNADGRPHSHCQSSPVRATVHFFVSGDEFQGKGNDCDLHIVHKDSVCGQLRLNLARRWSARGKRINKRQNARMTERIVNFESSLKLTKDIIVITLNAFH
jgi:hypothetical protein